MFGVFRFVASAQKAAISTVCTTSAAAAAAAVPSTPAEIKRTHSQIMHYVCLCVGVCICIVC